MNNLAYNNEKMECDQNHNIRLFLPKKKSTRFLMLGAFILGLLLTLVVISLLQIPDAQRYDTLKGDMSRVGEVHQRIVSNPVPIDVAFIGTSHTWNGISDKDIQTQLGKHGDSVSVANIASSWKGRDLHLFFLRQLLANKKPRLVVIEVGYHEYPYGHGVLPYVGKISDLFCCKSYLDAQFPSHLALFFKQQIVNAIAHKTAKISIVINEFGWMPLESTLSSSASINKPISLNQPMSLNQRLKENVYVMGSFYGLGVIEQMTKLAHENGVDIVFVYLPEYENVNRDPVTPVEYYTRFAPLIRIPEYISNDTNLWADGDHLNRKGALELVPFLAQHIHERLARK